MKIVQAGPISAGYENGFLRRISYGGNEVVRMIYFALRDHNWNTLNHHIENEIIDINDDDFQIRYDCFNMDGGVTVMEWKAKIAGSSSGSVIFELTGRATENFRKNRAGFCVLHPLNILGTECKLHHSDGSDSTRRFPQNVAPDNPFKNIQTMSWETSGTPFAINFEGDIFETEDQRNWGDASFKTFCTPLDRPFPAELRRGDKVFQRITFKPLKSLAPAAPSPAHVSIRETGQKAILPTFGISASTETDKLSDEVIALIRSLRLAHYRADVHPGSDRFAVEFSGACENAFALGLPLEAVLHLTDRFKEEMEAFTVICQQNKVRLKQVLLLNANGLVTRQEFIDQMMPMKGAFPRVLFGAGTNYNFNEINKNHFNPAGIDFISFSVDPQEHASDDLTILENTGSLEHLIQSAKAIYGADMHIHVSPLTMRKRFNPYATNPADLFIEEAKKADPRQKEILGALWTFGSIVSLAKGKASAVTFYQTAGNQGIVSTGGRPYPLYETLKGFSAYQGMEVSILESSDPHGVTGILVGRKMLAMANIARDEKTVRWNDREFRLQPGETKFEQLNRP